MTSYTIMMHPSREEFLPYLQETLGDVPVAMDTDNNIWTTCRQAWLSHDFDSDWCVVVQDDVIFTSDFKVKVEKILEGDYVYSFYLGNRRKFRSRVDDCKKTGAPYFEADHIYHEICLAFPTHRVKEMIAYCDSFEPDVDKIINKYVNDHNLKVRITMPSLVNHRVIPSLHSLNKSQLHTRTAIYFEK